VTDLPDAQWYLDNVRANATPGIDRPQDGDVLPVAAWQSWWCDQVSDETPLLRLACRQGFVVATAQLRDEDWADHDLRREVRRGTWWVPARGTASPVVIGGQDHLAQRRRHALRSTAAALVRPGHLISGKSAAILRGLPTMAVPRLPELTSPDDDWLGHRATNHLRHAGIAAVDRDRWFGAPVTAVPRTLVDLARHDRRSAIMAADAALREELTTKRELEAALSRARGWPGVRQAREIAALADGDAESPLESIVRLALHDDGFPSPKLQRIVAGYRVDFLWPEYRLILEADGRVKYSDDAWSQRDPLWNEKRRETALRRAGFEVERILWSDVFDGWDVMRQRLWRLIRR
jgi:very-short-patch-repair endonuclease